MSLTDTTQPPLQAIIYYHNPCSDGIAGAWCAWNYFEEGYGKDVKGSIEYCGCKPDEDIMPKLLKRRDNVDLQNVTIYFIDVLPTRDIPGLCVVAKQVVIMDHHKTNQEYISTLPAIANLFVEFDLNRSGAQIAWDYFNPDKIMRPWFIDYIGDRDLWAWKLPNSRSINSGLQNQGHLDSLVKFDAFYRANKDIDPETVMKQMLECGNAIESYQSRLIAQASENAVLLCFNEPKSGIKTQCWLGTITPDLVSELGNILAEKTLPNGSTPLFSVIYSYYILKDEYRLSLRSSDKNPQAADVSAIAKQMDVRGGGHKHAAGCKVSSVKFWQYFSKNK
jgi:oligoribonuclease NrnB/cAMP/cGMP phosphodiesterase (DHH superfamily)